MCGHSVHFKAAASGAPLPRLQMHKHNSADRKVRVLAEAAWILSSEEDS